MFRKEGHKFIVRKNRIHRRIPWTFLIEEFAISDCCVLQYDFDEKDYRDIMVAYSTIYHAICRTMSQNYDICVTKTHVYVVKLLEAMEFIRR